MKRLRAEPTSDVKTVADLHLLASGLARQAIALYDALALRMAEFDNDAAREAFKRLATIQREHARDADPTPGDLPEVHQDEGLRDLRLVTPYRVFALAVRNEERAFAFWSYISAHAATPDVKKEAERLALEEMDHVKVLQSERRRAYRQSPDPSFERLRTASVTDLRTEAARRESALAHLHERIADALAESGDDRAAIMGDIARQEHDDAKALGGAEDVRADPGPLPSDPEALVSRAIAEIEIAMEVYLFAADSSGREDVVALGQDLADRGLGRLARLRQEQLSETATVLSGLAE